MRDWLSPLGRSFQRPHSPRVGRHPVGGVAPWMALFGVAMILYVVSTAVYLEFARLLPSEPARMAAAPARPLNRMALPDTSNAPGTQPGPRAAAGTQNQFTAMSDDMRGVPAAVIAAPQAATGRQRGVADNRPAASTHRQRTAASDPLARQETLRILYTDLLQERAHLMELQQRLARRPPIVAARGDVPRPQTSGPGEKTPASNRPIAPAATFVSQAPVPARSADSHQPLDSATAARSLQHLIRTGNDTVALNLLRGFSERQAAKILARLWQQEPVVAKQLAQQLNSAR